MSRIKIKPDARELALFNGIQYPTDEELIMLILGSGTGKTPVDRLSRKVMKVISENSPDILVQKLLEIEGMGTSRALSIAASLELGRRRSRHLKQKIQKPQDVIPFVKQFTLQPNEHFVTITTNGANEILSMKVITEGTPTKAQIHPREVFSEAVIQHASGIICCHNHPAGQCLPSKADINCTKNLVQASELMGITLMDHIIITPDNYFSFFEHQMLGTDEFDDFDFFDSKREVSN